MIDAWKYRHRRQGYEVICRFTVDAVRAIGLQDLLKCIPVVVLLEKISTNFRIDFGADFALVSGAGAPAWAADGGDSGSILRFSSGRRYSPVRNTLPEHSSPRHERGTFGAKYATALCAQ